MRFRFRNNRVDRGKCYVLALATAWAALAAIAPNAYAAQQIPLEPPFDPIDPIDPIEPDPDPDPDPTGPMCANTISADVVALDQHFFWNRFGVAQPQGMIFALREDVVSKTSGSALSAGNVQLRDGKRPRPIVLRVNVGDCLRINFTNLLASPRAHPDQPATRNASIHVSGMQLVDSIMDDGSNVGKNDSSLVASGGSAVYTLFAEREGNYHLYSAAATTGGEGNGGTLGPGLHGSLNVEPAGSEWYRSQVTNRDIERARTGTSPGGHPLINYDEKYPTGHAQENRPIFKMLDDSGKIRHSDLFAIITGPGRNFFPVGTFPKNQIYYERDQSFREFTFIYQGEIGAAQAFPIFDDPDFEHTLHSVRDAFGINYGTGGIGAEILANRFGVGPVWDCTECKYEEFFLASWSLGDPAMIVDFPANSTLQPDGSLIPGPRATLARYPDDPSNVAHSYIRDHVKMRILHAGPKEHHIHHLHAHQWLYAPDSDNSAYLDSQAIGPGSAFTLEIPYNGTGNRNQVVGDSIFHCHFYPHFAQGMWHLWRSHDVFEEGTPLDDDGRPEAGSRALPDPEIITGSPIPAVVPIPGLVMAPMPEAYVEIIEIPGLPGGQVSIPYGSCSVAETECLLVLDGSDCPAGETCDPGNPGYPFFIPGLAGHRPPRPPLDIIRDGGLARHLITGGVTLSVESRLDFTKELVSVTAIELPEKGTDIEVAAMVYHEQRNHTSYRQDGSEGDFVVNGLSRKRGAPFADPCIKDDGTPWGLDSAGEPKRKYKAAAIQLDTLLSKNGWHFPQTRMLALRDDVWDTLNGDRPPQPLFMRANSNECIEYQLTNLVPHIYELDDFQIRTPTDILGQHIHLVKFDVTSSDGSANGWNYEDGSFSPGEVRERIDAIRLHNVCTRSDPRNGTFECPEAEVDPDYGPGPIGPDGYPVFLGAVTTVQRWMADDVLNNGLEDRTLRTVFTHDHFGPSTHQQAGLYAGLLIEPEGSLWRDPETGDFFPSRTDGGPTQFNVDIIEVDPTLTHREFMFEFADFQLAYEFDSNHTWERGRGPTFPNAYDDADFLKGGREPGEGFDDPAKVINPPAKEEAALPVLVQKSLACPYDEDDPDAVAPRLPCPEAISAADVGAMSVNLRTEPIALRVRNPGTNSQASGDAGDLAMVFRSDVIREDPAFNSQPGFYPPLTGGVQPGDPYTPLMRAYDGDRVQIRSMVGATEEGHNFSINGLKWLFEPSWKDSGWRNSQMMGISEHFEFNAPILRPKGARGPTRDFLYSPGTATDDRWTGMWGILRTYKNVQGDLKPLPNNPVGGKTIVNYVEFKDDDTRFRGVCPRNAPVRHLSVTVALARDILPEGRLTYNSREVNGGPLNDPTAIMYVRSFDLDRDGMLKPGVPIEPLILRANAGDCIKLTLRNKLPAVLPDLDGWSTLPMIVEFFNANDIKSSSNVGLHPQLLATDVTRSDGMNVGFNPVQTVPPGGKKKYSWYAGDISMAPDGRLIATPVEFGTVGLAPADPIKHASKGLVGVLIIEPENATWVEDRNSRASATVKDPDNETTFREFVLIFQSDVNMRYADGSAIPNVAEEEDAEDSGHKAFNYKSEPTWFRMGYPPDLKLEFTNDLDFSDAQSNSMVGGDPETPVFLAAANMPIRFRIAKPGGNARNHVFQLHGHVWQFEPYVNDSTELGDNPLSMWTGNQMGIGPSSHFDILPQNGAGGKFGIVGDYLYRDMASFMFDGGLWGIFRVGDPCARDADCDDGLFCNGKETCSPVGGCQAGEDPCPGEGCDELLSKCDDDCPLDPFKEEPGICGCGVPDIGDADGDGVLDCIDRCEGYDDNLDADGDTVPDGCDICPGESDLAYIDVRAHKHVVGSGSRPRTSKEPLVGIEVCAYDRSSTGCAVTTCGGTSFLQYECIATSCTAAACCTTDLDGECTMEVMPGNYIAIAYDSTRTILPDPLGRVVGNLGCGDTKVVRLRQIIRADGRKLAAKVTVQPGALAGSELEIIEPEFMVWDEDEQQYPFILEAVVGGGDWNVAVSTTPPAGSVADFAVLNSTVLDGAIEATQFVITEVGTELVPTDTMFVVSNLGIQQTVYSEVDLKLTEEYAISLGFNIPELESAGIISQPSVPIASPELN